MNASSWRIIPGRTDTWLITMVIEWDPFEMAELYGMFQWELPILTTHKSWEPILQVTCLELPLQKLGSFFHPLLKKPSTKKPVVSPILQVQLKAWVWIYPPPPNRMPFHLGIPGPFISGCDYRCEVRPCHLAWRLAIGYHWQRHRVPTTQCRLGSDYLGCLEDHPS